MNSSERSSTVNTVFHKFSVVTALLLLCGSSQAATTETIVVVQPAVTETVVLQPTPVVITRDSKAVAFEGRIVQVDYSRNQIMIQDSFGANRQVLVKSEMINSYRVGDYVQVRPTTELTVITIEENPKDFEGEIIRVNMSDNQIVVQDTNGRERRVQLKQGMIGTYKVDDYVRIHLMADLKEAKTIETVRGMGRHDGYVVRVDPQGSRMVVRDASGRERTVLVRQGTITNYRVGNQVRVYQLADHEDVQLVRMIRVS